MFKFFRKTVLVALAGMFLTSAAMAQNTVPMQPLPKPLEDNFLMIAEQMADGLPVGANPVIGLAEVQRRINAGEHPQARTEFERTWEIAFNWAFYDPNKQTMLGAGIPSGGRRAEGQVWLEYLLIKHRGLPAAAQLPQDRLQRLIDEYRAEFGRNRFVTGGDAKKGFWSLYRAGEANPTGRFVEVSENGPSFTGVWPVMINGTAHNIPFRGTFQNGVLTVEGQRVINEPGINNRLFRIEGTLTKVANSPANFVQTNVELKVYHAPVGDALPIQPQATHRGMAFRVSEPARR